MNKKISAKLIILITTAAVVLAAAAAFFVFREQITDIAVSLFQKEPAVNIEITEICAVSRHCTETRNTELPWIEIYNPSDEPIPLDGYVVRCDGREFTFSEKYIAPKSYLCCFTEKGFISTGESVLSLIRDGEFVKTYRYECPGADTSFLTADSSVTYTPTPGYVTPKEPDQIHISEVMTKNITHPVDGRLCDWIELVNDGVSGVDLSCLFISDDPDDRFGTRLPKTVLSPGEYILLRCGEDVPFSLSADGEILTVTRFDGVVSDIAEIPELEPDTSWNREGTDTAPTPGAANSEENVAAFSSVWSPLVINEVITSNSKYAAASDGCYYDLIEIYNRSTDNIDLSGYYLSDKSSDLMKWQLPAKTVRPGEFFIIYASGNSSGDERHAPFSLSSSGEILFLTDSEGLIKDCVKVPALPSDCSYGRTADGYVYYSDPTPGAANRNNGYRTVSSPVTPNLAPGIYSGPVSITLSGDEDGVIYYTTDGTVPVPEVNGMKYGGEYIVIESPTTVRAVCVSDSRLPVRETNLSYLTGEPAYTNDVLFITMDPAEFDRMYTRYSEDLEFEANCTLMNSSSEELFNVDCGIKLNGQSSRKFEKKTFQLKFRSKYGTGKLHCKLFDNLDIDEFNSLVIRSGSEGASRHRAFFNDEFITRLASETGNLLVQAYRPVNVYVNGEYYGIYYIREKVDEYFVSSHDGSDPESVTIINSMYSIRSGSSDQGWNELWKFIRSRDLTDEENYEYVKENICLESVADYYIMQAWSSNMDSGNVRVYKDSATDGKWKMQFFDLDITFDRFGSTKGYGTVRNMLSEYHSGKTDGLASYNAMIYKLLEVPEFRTLFRERLYILADTVLSAKHVNEVFEEMRDQIINDMEYSIPRWSHTTFIRYHKNMNNWLLDLEEIQEEWLCQKRLDNLIREFEEYLGSD